MNVNLVLSILFLVMTEICFGLNLDNEQLVSSVFVLDIVSARRDHRKFMLK